MKKLNNYYLFKVYKMSNLRHINFKAKPVPINQLEYTPSAKLYTYYQVCQFKNPFTDKHDIRKVVFDESGEIKKVYERQYEGSEVKKFVKSNNNNKYRIFPVREMSMVGYPSSGELLEVCSSLVNNDCKQYDYFLLN
jgi:hypothetical protein